MTYQKCPICEASKCHGGDKKLAAKHSKINQARFLKEQKRLEELNGAPVETKAVERPFRTVFNKTGARLLL